MPEPLKKLFNKTNLRAMGEQYAKARPEFEQDLTLASKDIQKLIFDYVIHQQKANG